MLLYRQHGKPGGVGVMGWGSAGPRAGRASRPLQAPPPPTVTPLSTWPFAAPPAALPCPPADLCCGAPISAPSPLHLPAISRAQMGLMRKCSPMSEKARHLRSCTRG